MTQKTPSLEAKKAYFAKVRRANYEASLRLEGFEIKSDSVTHSFSPSSKRSNRKEVKT